VSRIRVQIDRLVLNGVPPEEAKAFSQALQSELSRALADPAGGSDWARSHRTPMLKLGRMPLAAGTAGAGKFGKQVARSVRKGLQP
jgi:hypothetical protein